MGAVQYLVLLCAKKGVPFMFRELPLVCFGLFWILPLFAADSLGGIDLARTASWDIVLAEDAIETEVYAAEEFQQFFSISVGVQLPIVRTTGRAANHIFIGPGDLLRSSDIGFSIEDFGPEDLRIVVRDSMIAIAGGRPRGTLFGVYTFLEDYLGIRFLTPDYTHVPKLGKVIFLGPVDRTYRPPFANYRGIGYHLRKDAVFAVRCRGNNLYSDPNFGFKTPFCSSHININHSFYRQIPLDQYAESHPEYFCMWDGKRDNKHTHTHYCLTQPELVPIVTQAVIAEIEHPSSAKRTNFSVAQNDTIWEYCQCKNCTAVDNIEETHMGALLQFVNSVADEVGKKYPDAHIGTLAYGFSRKPPKTIHCGPKVQVSITSIEACQYHTFDDPTCPYNISFMQDLKGWGKTCDHLYAWTYNINFFDHLLPYPNLWTLEPNIRILAEAGVKGVFFQCSDVPASEFCDLRHYVLSRLAWNPDLDGETLVEEFLHLYYGKSAPPLRRFIDLVHDHYASKSDMHHSSCIKARWDQIVDEKVAITGLELFREALSMAEDEVMKERIEKASICAYRAAIEPAWKHDPKTAIAPELAATMRPLVAEFLRLADKYGIGRDAHREKLIKTLATNVSESE
jgi:uncharacterized protein DUF4838